MIQKDEVEISNLHALVLSLDSPDDNTGILKHGFKTTKSQSMITELQNDRSLFLLNRHNIFKLLSKKNISAIFLVENDFETGI